MVIYKTAELHECNLNFLIINLYSQFHFIDTGIFKNRDTSVATFTIHRLDDVSSILSRDRNVMFHFNFNPFSGFHQEQGHENSMHNTHLQLGWTLRMNGAVPT